jgi:hypothetical protein
MGVTSHKCTAGIKRTFRTNESLESATAFNAFNASLDGTLQVQLLFLNPCSTFFDVLVILTILVNCGFLAMDAPRFDNSDEPLVFVISEIVFTAIYSTEMIVKIIARGFVLQKHTYLRDPWNWLDFGVIVLA